MSLRALMGGKGGAARRGGIPVLLALVLCGCASYTDRIRQAQVNFIRADFPAAIAAIDPEDCEGGRDQLIFLLERATIKHTMGDFPGSNDDFEAAWGVIEDFESRATLSLRDGAAETGAILVNDTALPYKGEGFEKVLLPVYKAINYLMLGDLSGARVEIKRLDERLKIEQEAHEREISQAEEKAQEQNLSQSDISGVEQRLRAAYGPALSAAGRVKNLYLSAFGSFVSGLVYDLTGEYDESLIDARRVMEMAPGFAPAALDAYSLGADDIGPPPVNLDLRQRGDLVVIYQCGLAPEKMQVGIPIPVADGWLAVAFPVYQTIPTALNSATVFIDGVPAVNTFALTDVEAQAVKTLVDRIPAMVIRQMLRVAVKAVALHAARQQGGWAEFLVSMYNVFSEQADLRSWLTLPRSIQVARVYPPAGKHTVKIGLVDAGGGVVGEVSREMEFANNRTVLVNVRGIGYTPPLPGGVNVTAQWQVLPRAPLSGRPRFAW